MSFTPTVLYAGERTGSGTTAMAYISFAAKDCTGMTKSNGALVVDLKCSNIALLTSSFFEITSSGGPDSQEWGRQITAADPGIGTSYTTFTFPLTQFATQGGELNVSAINYLRFYVVASSSVTIGWQNARVYPYSLADMSLNLSTRKYSFSIFSMVLQTILGEWIKDLSLSVQAIAERREIIKLVLDAATNKLKSLSLDLSATDGTVLQNIFMLLEAVDGTIFEDFKMQLQAIKATPAFRSVTAHRVSSVLHEVV